MEASDGTAKLRYVPTDRALRKQIQKSTYRVTVEVRIPNLKGR